MIARRRSQRGDRRGKPVVQLGHGRRLGHLDHRREHLASPTLEPTDGDELRAVPTEGIGVTDLHPQPQAGLGPLLGLHQPARSHRGRHVERRHQVAQALARGGDQELPQLPQRPRRPSITGQHQVDGAPGKTHQLVDRPPGADRHADQLVGQPHPEGAVVGSEQAVVDHRQALGKYDGIVTLPRRLELGQQRRRVARGVRRLGGEAESEAVGQRVGRLDPPSARRCSSTTRASSRVERCSCTQIPPSPSGPRRTTRRRHRSPRPAPRARAAHEPRPAGRPRGSRPRDVVSCIDTPSVLPVGGTGSPDPAGAKQERVRLDEQRPGRKIRGDRRHGRVCRAMARPWNASPVAVDDRSVTDQHCSRSR